MRAIDIIKHKRDGQPLTEDEMRFFVKEYTSGNIPDYQAAAFLMACFLKGMNTNEVHIMTKSMMETGEIFDFSDIDAPKVDKHSTGGVGDKISLPLAPLVASCGITVPMISGRALGHTGGTLDKLESIKGYKTDFSPSEFKRTLMDVGASIIGQTRNIVPADKKLYALRDATATVESIPLIAASIMSKKMSEGLDGLVLDVKTGSGAFMREYEDAQSLANLMVSIGKEMGKRVIALITDMNQPLGRAVGNALEVRESVNVLMGKGPEDVTELTLTLGAYMLVAGGRVKNYDEGRKLIDKALTNGDGLAKWNEMVKMHGGDPDVIMEEGFLDVKFKHNITANKNGYLTNFNTYDIGVAVSLLGAGRAKKEDKIDHKVGIYVNKKIGDSIDKGDIIFEIRANNDEKMHEARSILEKSFVISSQKQDVPPLIHKIIGA